MSGKRFMTTRNATYWIDLFDKDNGDAREIFADWVRITNDEIPGAVQVLATEDFPDEEPPAQWIKFRTAESVPWTSNVPTMGLPTRIPDGAKVATRADTGTAADVIKQIDEETEGSKKLGLALMIGGALLVGAVAVALIVAEASAIRKVA